MALGDGEEVGEERGLGGLPTITASYLFDLLSRRARLAQEVCEGAPVALRVPHEVRDVGARGLIRGNAQRAYSARAERVRRAALRDERIESRAVGDGVVRREYVERGAGQRVRRKAREEALRDAEAVHERQHDRQ